MKSWERESGRGPRWICVQDPAALRQRPTPGTARGAVPPTPGLKGSPCSWLGLCMEEVAGNGFLGSSSPLRMVGAG